MWEGTHEYERIYTSRAVDKSSWWECQRETARIQTICFLLLLLCSPFVASKTETKLNGFESHWMNEWCWSYVLLDREVFLGNLNSIFGFVAVPFAFSHSHNEWNKLSNVSKQIYVFFLFFPSPEWCFQQNKHIATWTMDVLYIRNRRKEKKKRNENILVFSPSTRAHSWNNEFLFKEHTTLV